MTRMERYEDRKARRVCVECPTSLAPADRTRCSRCRERHRRLDSARARRDRAADRAGYNRSMREWRAGRVAAQSCTECKLAALPGLRCCAAHRDAQRRRALAYYHRQARCRLPVVSIPVLDAIRAQARREATPPSYGDSEGLHRRISARYEVLLRNRGLIVGGVNDPPPGWTVAEDIREEWLALSEISALRRCA